MSEEFRSARMLFLALTILGPVPFAAVAVFLVEVSLGGGALEGELPLLLVYGVWAVLALGGLALARKFRDRAISAGLGASGAPDEAEGSRDAAASASSEARSFQQNIVIAAAALEGPALIGVVFYLLTGDVGLLVLTLAVLAYGIWQVFPRSDWASLPGATRSGTAG